MKSSLVAKTQKLCFNVRKIKASNPNIDEKISKAQSELPCDTFFTNCLGFQPEKPIFILARDGSEDCEIRDGMIEDYWNVRTIQAGQFLFAFSPNDFGVSVR